MKKLINKIIAGTMAAAIALSTGVTAFAADTQQITPGNTGSTTVKANVESEAVVWLPTNITISGTPDENNQYTGEGAVIVEGDIAGNEFISVTPESSISLKQSGKDDIIAQVTQEKTTFTYDDLQNSNSAITSISTDTLSAGEWSSVLHYNVSLDENPLPPGYTTLYEYDLSATAADDVKAYYMVPNKNTSPIEVEKQANKIKSRTAATSDQTEADNIIEYNGIRYVLSDEDELVISGEGEMKENIQADLIDYVGIYEAVAKKFNVHYYIGVPATEEIEGEIYVNFTTNSLKPYWITQLIDGTTYCTYNIAMGKGYKHSPELDELSENIEAYINEIYSEYVVAAPKNVVILNGVTNISDHAFYDCISLTNITIADSVTTIDSSAFAGCENLTDISIPDSVTEISSRAFSNCYALKEIVIPNSVSRIGNSAFYACNSLQSAYIGDSVKQIGEHAFSSCDDLKSVYIPDSVTQIGKMAFMQMKPGATIYCETQRIANMLKADTHYTKGSTRIVVDASMFL